ncbi:MAG: hypothetical protein GYB50_20265, partial [Rhodobacteraceae bacterium]|nr:hypothetical protein [Paracoccaceae bacterium]
MAIQTTDTAQELWQGNPVSAEHQPETWRIVAFMVEILAQAQSAEDLDPLLTRLTALEDQAFADAPIYDDTAAGIAATSEGEQFRVENGDPDIAYDVYEHETGGVATLIASVPAVSALATKLTASLNLSDLSDPSAALGNLGAASTEDVEASDRRIASLEAGTLRRDGFAGWAAPVFDRERRVGGGWKRDGTFHAKGFGVGASGAPARDVPRTPLAKGNADRVALSVDEAGMLRGRGFATPAPVAPARDVPHLPVVHDLFGRASIALEPSGAVVLSKISERTAQMIRALVGVSESIPGGLLEGLPGWNHRIYDEDYYLLTMPTKMGPVDVLYPISGAGLQIAATRKPVELLSVSGQSNTFLGGDMDAGINGFALRGVYDPHRAFRSAHGNSWGDGSGSAAAYTPGDLSAMVPAGQDAEPNNAGQFTPDVIQFSAIATDLREGRQQGVYLQLTSAESG